MKVLYVIQRYRPAKLTGSEKVIATLCAALTDQPDLNLTVITSDVMMIKGLYDPRLKPLPKRETIDGVTILRLKVNWFVGSVLHVLTRLFPQLNRLGSGRIRMQSFGPHLIGLRSAILREQPDLIHTGPMPLNHVFETWKIAQQYKIPLVITPMMHFDHPMFSTPLIYTILNDSQQIITFTHYEKNELMERGLDGKKIAVIPATYLTEEDFTAGDGQRFRKAHKLADEPIVLFLGTKAYEKGAMDLLAVWPLIRKAVPKARLVFAGLPTMTWQKAYEGQVNEGIINLDYVDGQAKHDLLQACTVLAVPSRTESFGIVTLEAWAKGKPVIGGPTGATKEVITEGVDGFSVGFGDQAMLTERLITILQDSDLQRKLGEAGQKKARQLTKEIIAKQTKQVYEKALQQDLA